MELPNQHLTLFETVNKLIVGAKQRIASTANYELTMLYERTAISKKPDELITQELQELGEKDTMTPDLVFRDPYLLDFLGLKDTFSEKDLETAILADLQRFITELGSDFAFLARQKRITVDQTDYYVDLLFYHRSLRLIDGDRTETG